MDHPTNASAMHAGAFPDNGGATPLPPIATGVGLFVSALSAVVGITCLGGIALSLLNRPPVWYTFGFELVALVACVFGVWTGLGRYRQGPALALLCVAGAIGVGALLGYVGAPAATTNKLATAVPALSFMGPDRGLLGMPLWPLMLARAVAAAALTAAAAIIVLSRQPQLSRPRVVRAIVFAVLLVLVAAPLWLTRAQWIALGTFPKLLIGVLGTVLALGLFAAAVHYAISAFEPGDPDEPQG